MTVNLVAWGVAQILRMHATERQTATVPDPHARWRDLIVRDNATATYRRGRCGQCRDDGTCELLDAAKQYAATVFPLPPDRENPDSDLASAGDQYGSRLRRPPPVTPQPVTTTNRTEDNDGMALTYGVQRDSRTDVESGVAPARTRGSHEAKNTTGLGKAGRS